tara:strand:- start:564 stop:1700 length:1137 start_codon:yes stop_codon:yes gene_type:complete
VSVAAPTGDKTAGGPPPSSGVLDKERPGFLQFFLEEKVFLGIIASLLIAAGLIYPYAGIARWFGFAIAAYSAVGNDSIQTIGTFIASNRDKPWWLLWLFIGGLFVATVTYSWVTYDGDVSYQRLAAKGFAEAPQSFTYLQVAAPIFLIILTRMRMPVSTTFLLLSCFATEVSGIGSVIKKSLIGYVIAFVLAIVVWMAVSKVMQRVTSKGKHHSGWRVFQWITSGALWSVWIMQDAANIAVYLDRSLALMELLAFVGVVFIGLGLLFYLGGERIQQVVEEKSDIKDVRSATVVDLVYAVILYVFKIWSNVPMSTTWVFVGLLAGRELAMAFRGTTEEGWRGALKLMTSDLWRVSLGFLISLALALAVNETFRRGLLGF